MKLLLSPIGVFVAIGSIFFGFWMAEERSEFQLLRVQSQMAVEEFSNRAQSHVAERVAGAATLADVWSEDLPDPDQEFVLRASTMVNTFGGLLAANWVEPDGTIRIVAPVVGNEDARGRNLFLNPSAAPAIRSADETGLARFTPPIDLYQGFRGFAAYVPIAAGGTRTGFINVVFRSQTLFESITKNDAFLKQFRLDLISGDASFFDQGPAPAVASTASRTFELGDSEITVFATPLPVLVQRSSTLLGEWVLAFGLLIAAFVAFLFHRSDRSRLELASITRHLEATLDAVPDLHVVLDADARVIDSRIPEGTLEIPGELNGKYVGTGFNAETTRAIDSAKDEVSRSGQPHAFSYGWGTGSHQKWFEGRMLPMEDDHFLLVSRDVTARRLHEAEEMRLKEQMQLTQKLESLGVLAGGIAHDFNNILVSVLGNAQLAREMAGEDTKLVTRLGNIESGAERAAVLCKQMLAYAGRSSVEVAPSNISEIVDEMAELLEASLSKKVEITYDIAENLRPVLADMSQLRQVILNIVMNSVESFGDEAGVVSVRTGSRDCDPDFLAMTYLNETLQPGNFSFVQVTDNGRGMTPETISRIFDPFFTTKELGRGLGLAAVVGIIKSHRGALDLRSRPGQGTTFTVYFPEQPDEAEKTTAVPAEDDEWRPSGKVMVVDDEDSVRELAVTLVERLGFETVAAPDGTSALEFIRSGEHKFSAVLLDVTMPDISGIEVLEQARRDFPDLPIVLTSGYSENGEAISTLRVKPTAFLQKPYSMKKFAETLRFAIESGHRDTTV